MRKGFTLVELAIVLVIIGLIIGGILVARSMIHAAKISEYVRKLEQYEIAVSNFKLNYKYEPGDDTLFAPAGNQDGELNNIVGGCTGTYSNNEFTQIWSHLSQAEMLKNTYVPYAPQTCGGPHDDLYENNVGIVSPVFAESSAWPGYEGTNTTKITLSYYSQPPLGRNFSGWMSALDALALDAKMDNNRSATGNMRVYDYNGDPCGNINVNNNDPNMTLCVITYFPDNNPYP